MQEHSKLESMFQEENKCLLLLRSSKNAFIMQSKSTFLEFFDVYSSLQIWPPKKNISGAKLFRANDVISIEHVLCS